MDEPVRLREGPGGLGDAEGPGRARSPAPRPGAGGADVGKHRDQPCCPWSRARVCGSSRRAGKVPEEKKELLRILGAELDVVADALCPMPGAGWRRHDQSCQDARKGAARPLRDAQPVREPAERERPPPHHGPRDLAPDRGKDHAPVRLTRHVRHGLGDQQVPQGEEPGRESDCRSAVGRPRHPGASKHLGAGRQQALRSIPDR